MLLRDMAAIRAGSVPLVGRRGLSAFPVGAGAAVLLLSVSESAQSRKRLILDGAIVAASMFLISRVTVLDRLTTDSQRARNTVGSLRRLEIRLSLDDYGTGLSSVARLHDLSVDELKLDKVFVARLARDPRSIAIVRSTVALAHNLGADLVAEGVEDEATLHALRRYGCAITQGHVHSPPLPADELHAWLVNRTPQLTMTPSREAGVLD